MIGKGGYNCVESNAAIVFGISMANGITGNSGPAA